MPDEPSRDEPMTTDTHDAPLSGTDLDSIWDFGDPPTSEARFRARLAAGTDGPLAAAELQTQLARALGLQGRFDEADTVLDDLVAGQGDDPIPPILDARIALERGRVLNSSGSRAAAVAPFEQALDSATAAGDDFLAADAAHMLAIADGDRADDWTRRGLQIVDGSTDVRTRRWAGSLHNNLGWSLHDAGHFDEALEQFEGALTAYQAAGTDGQVRMARWAVARCLRSLERYDDAMAIQTELSAGPSEGYVEEELGELLLVTGRGEEAAPYFAAAAQKLGADDWLVEHEPDRIERLRTLGGAGADATRQD